jgi:hypothetical protein
MLHERKRPMKFYILDEKQKYQFRYGEKNVG